MKKENDFMPNDNNSENLSENSNIADKAILTAPSLQLWTSADKNKLESWFDVSNNFNANNELYTDYAYYILEKNFARFGVEFKREFHEKDFNWYSFSWFFRERTCSYVFSDEHSEMMRDIFSDFADFCNLVPGKKPWRYAVLLKEFLHNFQLPEKIITLLPEKILEKFPEVQEIFRIWMTEEVDAEQQRISEGMMGY